jgi:hypothetical protein
MRDRTGLSGVAVARAASYLESDYTAKRIEGLWPTPEIDE